jgi:predicted amidohydrolase YtcJ
MVLVNGRVFTVDDAQPRAEAFAVKNGRFMAVGSTADVRNLVAQGTQVIDAEGMTVTPGFIDAHCHADGVRDLFSVDLDVRTIAEIKRRLAAKAADTPPDHWVNGFKYDDTKVRDQSTGRYRRINRWDLDEAVPNSPVRVSHRGGHIAWYNSKALGMAGIDRTVEDPFGGRFERTEDGELTGLVEERAQRMFDGVGVSEERTRADRQAGVKYISERMTAAGLTSVHQTGVSIDNLIALQDAYGFGDDWLKVGGIKYAADGSCSGRTMAMSTPYEGRPNDYGILTMTQEEIHEVVEDGHRRGFQIGIHANGDLAIDMVLNAYERVQELWPRPDPRHRLEHCTLVNPDLLRRIKATGSIPTKFWTYVHYHGNKWGREGPTTRPAPSSH